MANETPTLSQQVALLKAQVIELEQRDKDAMEMTISMQERMTEESDEREQEHERLVKHYSDLNDNLYRIQSLAYFERDLYMFKCDFITRYREAWENQDTPVFIREMIEFYSDYPPMDGGYCLDVQECRDYVGHAFTLRHTDGPPTSWRFWLPSD
jgi:hypothetical protein